jgi:PleD family two-component response regulator
MILCAIDDLMFSVKVKMAAQALNADVYFARTPGQVLASIRERQPTLVIFDLNSARLEPMAVLAAMQADESLRQIRTLGYASHVDAATIAAARQAGVGQVLARSAFVERLGEILTSA